VRQQRRENANSVSNGEIVRFQTLEDSFPVSRAAAAKLSAAALAKAEVAFQDSPGACRI